MKLFNFIAILNDELRTKYYQEILTDNDVSDKLMNEILEYIKISYASYGDVNSEIVEVLECISDEEKDQFMKFISRFNSKLYNNLQNRIFNFESIVDIDPDTLREDLNNIGKEDLIYSSFCSSPNVKVHLSNTFVNIDFDAERALLKSIPVNTSIDSQSKILSLLNEKK